MSNWAGTSTEKEKIVSNLKTFLSFISVGSGRHRRNGFEERVTNENLYSALLHFSNEDLVGSDKIKPNFLHIVNKAYLSLSVTQINSSKMNFGGSVKFTLYQLMEESNIRSEAAITMESQIFTINENHDNKILFDASETIQSWFLDERTNQG